MSSSLQIYVDTSNEEYLTEKIERGELYILCRENVDDCEGLYCKNGKIYRVVDMSNFTWVVEGEDCLVSINREDCNFIPMIKGGVVNGS